MPRALEPRVLCGVCIVNYGYKRFLMRSRLVTLLLLPMLCCSVLTQAQNLRLPDFGDPSLQYLSAAKERQLGAAMLQELRMQGAVIEDVQLNEYLNSVGQRIAATADNGHPYTFYWLDSGSINAFAAPGGYIAINAGLLLATRDEAELAGVIGHEIAHVAQRHIARQYADSQQFSLPVAAAMLASVALAAAGGSQAGGAAMASVLAANAQHQINMTRSNEQEADRVGYQLLLRSGFDADGMTRFFDYLQRLPGESVGQLPEFLLTHPRPGSRVADTQQRLGNTQAQNGRRYSQSYALAKARMQALTSSNNTTLLKMLQERLAKGAFDNEPAERYGYALALKQAGRYDEALAQIQRLLQRDPDNLAFLIERAEITLASGQRAQAWRLFEQAQQLFPQDYTLAVHYGRALAAQGDPAKAQQVLQAHLQRHSRDLWLYEIYAQAAQRAGDAAAAHGALAEFYYLSGNLNAAVEQAELGVRSASAKAYERARLQARLRQFREEETRQ